MSLSDWHPLFWYNVMILSWGVKMINLEVEIITLSQNIWYQSLSERLRWSRGKRAGLWYPSSRVQTRPKPSDFWSKKILSTPSFGGEVKPSVPCHKFMACKRTQKWRGSRHFRQNSQQFLAHSSTFCYWGSLASFQTLETPCGRRCNVLNHWSSRLGVWRATGNGTL